MEEKILSIESKKEEKFLREKTKPFSVHGKGFSVAGNTLTKRELHELIMKMRKVMHRANGVGLSANQIGLPYKLFVAKLPAKQGESKLHAILNPEIEKMSEEKLSQEEGCLSVHGKYGIVPRAKQVIIRGLDKNGKPLKIKAWGLLARIFQHEVEHLNGKLFVDRAKEVYEVPRADRLKEFDRKLKANE